MSEKFVPDDRFVERLEWQLASEYRREKLLRPARRKIAVSRRMAAAFLVAGIFMTGVTAIKAAEYFKDSWRKKIEIARVETEVRLKEALRESARQAAVRIDRLASVGMVHETEAQAMKQAVEKAGLALDKSLLNRDEVRASGEFPRDEISAPTAGGRDFVSERLAIERKQAGLEMSALKTRRLRLRQLIELGLVSETELNALAAEEAAQKAAIEKIETRLSLRKRFIDGLLTAQEAEIEDRLAVAGENLRAASAKVESLRERVKRLEALEARGVISTSETGAAKTDLDLALDEQKLAALEIDILKKAK
jgi:hypothetical protein